MRGKLWLEVIGVLVDVLGPHQQVVQNHFHRPGNGVKVNLQIHLQAADDVVFHRVHSGNLKGDSALDWSHYMEDPVEVKFTVVGTGVVGIPLEVVHPVGVDLARNHLNDLLVFVGVVDDTSDLVREVWGNPPEDPVNVGPGTGNQLAGDLFVVCIKNMFKGMGIWSVPQVMQEGCTEGDWPLVVVPTAVTCLLVRIVSLEIVAHFPGNFVNPKAVSKAGVFGPVKGKGRGSQLLNPPETLKFRGVNQV